MKAANKILLYAGWFKAYILNEMYNDVLYGHENRQ